MKRSRPTLFISYGHQDKDLARKLARDLSSKGIYVFDDNMIEVGVTSLEKVRNGLRNADCVLGLITPNSISSANVMEELEMANGSGKLQLLVIYGDVKSPDFLGQIQTISLYDSPNEDNYSEVLNRIVDAVFMFVEKRDVEKANPIGVKAESNIATKGKIAFKEEIEGTLEGRKKTSTKESKQVSNKGDKSSEVNAPPSSTSPAKRNYWLLKMNPQTWEIDRLSIDNATFFSTHYYNQSRPEYHLFSQIKKGDYVMGFASGNYQSIVCEMEVTQPVGPNPDQGESFAMVVKELTSPRVPLSKFRDNITAILPRLEQNTKPPELFFELSETDYTTILSSGSSQVDTFEHLYQPFFLTEGDHKKTTDQLDFENDYNSFASVIALRRVNPPLAIGLFGNWGSGKSFFMEKLSEQIEKIADSKDSEFVEHVVHVKFNSWHYSDTNLWASLTTQIFESLNDYAQKKQFGPDAINAIYKDLNITSYQLAETKRKLDANETQSTILKEQKKNVEDVITQKKEALETWKAKDLVKLVFSDPLIQKDFQNIRSQFEEEKLIENIDQIDEKLLQIDNVRGQIVESFTLLKKNRKGKWKWIWGLACLSGIISWLVLGPLKGMIQDYVNGGYIITGLFLAWLSNLIAKLTPYFNKISQFYRRLKSLKQTVEKAKENVRLKEHDEVEHLQSDINRLVAERETLELQQKQAEEKKQLLQKEIAEIGSGKLLANFLKGKSADDAYIKQLGIISWIRKDFLELNNLFQKQKSVQANEKDTAPSVQIDRIVLYIDDLDRCNEDVVVKVLEAIHLLLAFPLFVVVVGVDPRWLNNALSEKYKNLFGKRDIMNNENGDPVAQPNQENIVLAEAATSYDYLEKIFQIPFALKPINKTGREKLIQYLIKDEMEGKTTNSNKPVDSSSSLQGVVNKQETATPLAGQQPEVEKKEGNSTNEKTQVAKKVKERLIFTEKESAYMQKISPLFGQTPRTINRYVNIYRIIKAHDSLKVVGSFSEDEFMPLMFILGVVAGHSAFAVKFIAELSEAVDTLTFQGFLQGSKLDRSLVDLIKLLASEIEAMPMADFKRNLELISRFSFRTLLK